MDAIIYTSNTGFTKKYAELLGEKTGLPVCPLKEAMDCKFGKCAEIIYLGWLKAGFVSGFYKANNFYHVSAVVGVGMGKSGGQLEDVKKMNRIHDDIAVFTVQGGFDMSRLRGINKLMMSAMRGSVGKKLKAKTDRTPDEDEMLDMLFNGGDKVDIKNLDPLLEWYARETEE